MNVLIVYSGNHATVAPFIEEQADALRQTGVNVRMFGIEGHGVVGYLKNIPRLLSELNPNLTHLIHCHYGLCGLVAGLQRRVPVVTTYHGSDINDPKILPLSRMTMRLSTYNIFVSSRLASRAEAPRGNSTVLPCGVDTTLFRPSDRAASRQQMGLDPERHYVLFAGAFSNEVKNPELAKSACALLPDTELLELNGYTREQVVMLMNAVDCLLMTSHSEGSPQVVKEAMACDLPVVSVGVGDVPVLLDGLPGCSIVARDPMALATAMRAAFNSPRPDGKRRLRDLQLDNADVVRKLCEIYKNILPNTRK